MAEQFSRQELYDLVWSQPMSKLASRFRMSDVALKKHCARADAPTPDRGYWAKKESGKPTIQVALPRRPPGMSDQVFGAGGNYWYRSWSEEELLGPVPAPPQFSEPIEAVKEWITKEVGKISVPREIRVWHPAIERLLKEDDKRREEHRTKGYSWIKPLFESPFEQRRLRILNSVFFGAGKMFGKARITDKNGRDISIRFHDSFVRISLDRLKQSGRKGGQSIDEQNPKLSLGISKDYSSDALVMSWADDDEGRLEKKLTQIVIEVILSAEINNREGTVRSYEWRVKRKAEIEEERRQLKVKAERQERERQARQEQARIDRLMKDAAAFERAAQIRKYVESIRATVQAQIQANTNQAGDNPFGALAQNIGSLVINAVHLRPGPGLYALAASASVGALLLHSGLLPKDSTEEEVEQGDQYSQNYAGARLFAFVVIAVLVVGAAVFVLRHQGSTQITSRPTGNVKALVPFVGCPADGQGGPVAPPHRKDKVVSIPADLVQDVAYYGAGASGVLAPRGWYCFETYGSGGTALFIAPSQFDSSSIFSDNWPGFTGPAIEFAVTSTETSGRFAAAKTIARIFPAQMDFVRTVEAEGIDVDAPYPVGPFPQDTLKYINTDAVEYSTPPNETGLGTLSRLKVNGNSITGVAILHLEKGSLLQLSVRLPDDMAGLRPIIIRELERENIK